METDYYKKYQLEFDDVIEGEFNDYRLEIHKKLLLADASTVTYSTDFTGSSAGWTISANAVYSSSLITFNAVNANIYRSIELDAGSYYISSEVPTLATRINVEITDASGEVVITNNIDATGVDTTSIFVAEAGTHTLTISSPISGGNAMDNLYLYQFDYDASATLQGTGTPLMLNYDNTGDDILSPIKSSYLDINFYQTETSQDYSELFAPEDLDFKVFLYKNDSLFWRGWLPPSMVTISQSSVPINISLRAYDGIHLLKNIPYISTDLNAIRDSPNATDRFDYQSLLNTLTKCLYNTGVDNNYYFQCRLKQGSNNYLDFFTHTRTYHRTWIKDQESMTCFEVLETMCNDIGLSVYQRDGNWIVNRLSDLCSDRTGYTALSVTSVSSVTEIPETIGTEDASGYVDTTSFSSVDGVASITYQYATAKVTVKHEHDQNCAIGDFTRDEIIDTSSNGFTEWYGATASDETVVLKNETNYTETGDESAADSFIEVSLSEDPTNYNEFIYHGGLLSWSGQPMTYYGDQFSRSFAVSFECRPIVVAQTSAKALIGWCLKLELGSSQTAYYVNSSVEADTSGVFTLDGGRKAITEPNQWAKKSWWTPKPATVQGDDTNYIRFQFHGSYSVNEKDDGTTQELTASYYSTSLQNLKIKPLIGATYRIAPSMAEYTINTDDSYSYEYEDIEVYGGSNIVTNGSKAYLCYDASSGDLEDIFSDSWDVWTDGRLTGLTMQHARALAKLLMYHKPVRRLEGTHYGNYKFGNVIRYDSGENTSSGDFFPIRCSMDLRNARVSFSADDILKADVLASLSDGTITKKIRWIDEKERSYTETL